MRIGAGRKRCRRTATAGAGAAAILLALTVLTGGPSRAAGRLDGILACRRIADSSSRLACFDRESAALASPGRAAAPEPHTARARAPVPGPGLDPRQTFGLAPERILAREEAAQHLPHQLDQITARIALVSRAADGRDIFTLDNHEVWAQLVPDDDLYARPGDVVKISRAMLGSYWLAVKSRRGGCKVTRLR